MEDTSQTGSRHGHRGGADLRRSRYEGGRRRQLLLLLLGIAGGYASSRVRSSLLSSLPDFSSRHPLTSQMLRNLQPDICYGVCRYSQINDGICQPGCEVEECDWDGDDCAERPGGRVASIVQSIGDTLGLPDAAREEEAGAGAAGGGLSNVRGRVRDAIQTRAACLSGGCRPFLLGNGVCDAECNTEACGNDGGDCKGDLCASGCHPEHRGDGFCDPLCNVAACKFDDGDCEAVKGCPGCSPPLLGDGQCDEVCNVEACNWDEGDCK
ncbi:unnamed protein product [Vitrella brassicaformis CCMP3155]|uniref:LNR domain-containing protein n=3 Tax=Vitrella brassicaformis TaxID=1169539 RepID=A0A0G4G8F5_VITBC|nr:unnamed protein product [Vitrella brassicaformis CCMP3155]|eukprot:CEM25079.1 unnamed protein product [Vitrella brassicaformis CCMP3155]